MSIPLKAVRGQKFLQHNKAACASQYIQQLDLPVSIPPQHEGEQYAVANLKEAHAEADSTLGIGSCCHLGSMQKVTMA